MQRRADDFAARRARLAQLSDEALRARFAELVERLVVPLVERARTHTTPAVERSVLLRMGLSSAEAKALALHLGERGLLGHGAGRLLLELAQRRGLPVREAARRVLDGSLSDELAP